MARLTKTDLLMQTPGVARKANAPVIKAAPPAINGKLLLDPFSGEPMTFKVVGKDALCMVVAKDWSSRLFNTKQDAMNWCMRRAGGAEVRASVVDAKVIDPAIAPGEGSDAEEALKDGM